MNLKAIDAAIAAYRTNLDEGDVSRLAFFRELWGVQAEAASHVDLGYEVPDADSLKTWARHGEPVLSHAPVKIEAGAMAAALALRAFLEGPATAVERALREAGADEPHSVRCPVCGGEAAVAQVSGAPAGQGRAKRLWCAQCGCAWEFERVRCVRCGTQNQSRLHYFNLEGDEAHRLATCDECGGYTRTVYEEDALAPFSFEVEDVVMAKLDLVAYQRAAADAAAEAQR